jgi:acyl-CoA synthetase (AMP-forming)/AMP-acid ligase II
MIRELQHASSISQLPAYWASVTPGAPAIVEGEKTLSYAALWLRIRRAYQLLRTRGVSVGDRVMIVGENCSAQVAFLFAAAELHAWPVLVNARLSAREVGEIAAHCRPRTQIFTHAVSREAQEHGERIGARPVGFDAMQSVLMTAADNTARAESCDVATTVAALIYTSGTTGAPKGVMVTHRGLLEFARTTSSSRTMGSEDMAYAALPLAHIFGLGTVLLGTMYAGGSLYLQPRFSAANALAALSTQGITILQGVPAMFRQLLTELRSGNTKLHAPTLRYLYAGGATLTLGMKQEVERVFELPLHHGYGMTEYAGSVCVTSGQRPRHDCSSGYPIPGVEMRIIDERGCDVSFNRPGEIWVRGPGVMFGYYRAAEQTANAIGTDGWLKTGDIGCMNDEGALFIVGRKKDVIIVSGFNVYPAEVESVIDTYPGIRRSAVVGRPSADGNEEVIAFIEVECDAAPDMAGLRTFLSARIAPYKRPVIVQRIATLPTTVSGKLKKQELRRLAAELGCEERCGTVA